MNYEYYHVISNNSGSAPTNTNVSQAVYNFKMDQDVSDIEVISIFESNDNQMDLLLPGVIKQTENSPKDQAELNNENGNNDNRYKVLSVFDWGNELMNILTQSD